MATICTSCNQTIGGHHFSCPNCLTSEYFKRIPDVEPEVKAEVEPQLSDEELQEILASGIVERADEEPEVESDVKSAETLSEIEPVDESSPLDIENMSVKELKVELTNREIDIKGINKRADLVKLLVAKSQIMLDGTGIEANIGSEDGVIELTYNPVLEALPEPKSGVTEITYN